MLMLETGGGLQFHIFLIQNI